MKTETVPGTSQRPLCSGLLYTLGGSQEPATKVSDASALAGSVTWVLLRCCGRAPSAALIRVLILSSKLRISPGASGP